MILANSTVCLFVHFKQLNTNLYIFFNQIVYYNLNTYINKFELCCFAKSEVTDPVGDVMNFINSFNENYGPHHPVFYQGSYSQALNDAKQELRFLLVYLHADNNQDCTNFCR